MPKRMTVIVPDAAYDALRAQADQRQRTPEELVLEILEEKFGAASQGAIDRARERLITLMRSQGNLMEWSRGELARQQHHPEYAAMDETIADELSDALDRSGLDILDLIERR